MPAMPTRRGFRAIATLLATVVIPLAAVRFYSYYYYYSNNNNNSSNDNHDSHYPPDLAMTSPSPTNHIIIVGAGLAGLAAAHAALAASDKASVLLLERAPKPGGNSIKASSGINGAPTRFQPPDSDSADLFCKDTVKSAGARLNSAGNVLDRDSRERLIRTLADRSAAAVHFLHDDVGIDLSVVAQLGGHSVARTHRGAGRTPPGFAIVSTLLAKLKENPRFELRTGCDVTRLLTSVEDSSGAKAVVGVEYTTLQQEQQQQQQQQPSSSSPSTPPLAQAHGPVIFAAGGFAGDATGLLVQHRPDLGPLPSTNEAHAATAHGILARDAGADLVDMDSVQVHPTGFIDPAAPAAPVKILAAELLRGAGGILLRRGRRFVDELDTREHVSAAIMAEPPASAPTTPRQWDVSLLLDPGARAAAASHLGFYEARGLMKRTRLRDLDEPTRAAVREYAAAVAARRPDPLGRRAFGSWTLAPAADDDDDVEVSVGSVTPITHFTMGGAAINDRAQVLAAAHGRPIEGLWAAGEITGGVHGDNRLGGSSLLECVVFGRIAGEEAAKRVG